MHPKCCPLFPVFRQHTGPLCTPWLHRAPWSCNACFALWSRAFIKTAVCGMLGCCSSSKPSALRGSWGQIRLWLMFSGKDCSLSLAVLVRIPNQLSIPIYFTCLDIFILMLFLLSHNFYIFWFWHFDTGVAWCSWHDMACCFLLLSYENVLCQLSVTSGWCPVETLGTHLITETWEMWMWGCSQALRMSFMGLVLRIGVRTNKALTDVNELSIAL